MKFHTLALAAALTLGGAAFAAPNHTAKAPATSEATHAVKMKHHAGKHMVRHTAKKHHKSTPVAKRHQMHRHTASVQTDVNSGSRQSRMDEALKKFRTAHS